MYFGMNTFVGRVVNEDGIEGDFIKNFKHGGGAAGQEVGQNSFGIYKMLICSRDSALAENAIRRGQWMIFAARLLSP